MATATKAHKYKGIWIEPCEYASPEHGARMLAAVDALMALTVDRPEKLPEVSR